MHTQSRRSRHSVPQTFARASRDTFPSALHHQPRQLFICFLSHRYGAFASVWYKGHHAGWSLFCLASFVYFLFYFFLSVPGLQVKHFFIFIFGVASCKVFYSLSLYELNSTLFYISTVQFCFSHLGTLCLSLSVSPSLSLPVSLSFHILSTFSNKTFKFFAMPLKDLSSPQLLLI